MGMQGIWYAFHTFWHAFHTSVLTVLIVSCNLFHREVHVGRMNIYIAASVLAYGTKRFLSFDDLVIVVGAGSGMSSVGT